MYYNNFINFEHYECVESPLVMSGSVGGRARSFEVHQALDSAVRVFWEYGYHDATLDRLTRSMGINKPSLFLAFGNKQELFRKSLEHYRACYLNRVFAELQGPGSTRQVFERFFEKLVDLFTCEQTPAGCLVALTLASGCPDQVVEAELKNFIQNNIDAMAQRLKMAKARGELAETEDPIALATFFSAITYTLAIAARIGEDPAQVKSLAWTALRLLPETVSP
jgi:AcrR family transcriptional regulator